MTIILIVLLCTTEARDSCQAYAAHQFDGHNARYECLASIEPTLDAMRRDYADQITAAYCEESEQ